MLFYENIRLALFSLKANKMRSLLTMLGIIIGIASVIAIMTVGDSMTSSVTDSMSSMGASNINVSLQQREDEDEDTETVMKMPTEDDYFTLEMLQNYVDTYPDSIRAISVSESLGSGQIKDGSKYANVSVTGTNYGYFTVNDIELLSGRSFNDKELTEGKQVALISDKAVNNMFGGDKEEAVGSEIQILVNDKYYTFIVIGVYEYEQSAMLSTSSDRNLTTECYIPLRTAKSLGHTSGYSNFTVMTTGAVDPDEFASMTQQFFNTYYRTNRDFEVMAYTLSSIVEMMSSMMGTITTAISVIAGIALVVGGIGVMNIMLVSITERTREIGTRKALGAPNSSIRMQFIVEAIVVCLIGGFIGILLGSALGMGFANYLGTPATPSVRSIVLSISFSMAIGVFFGYYPANKAAKMDPIEALRYE